MFRANAKLKEDLPQTTSSTEDQHDGVMRTRIVIYERFGPVCENQDVRQTNKSESKDSRPERSAPSNVVNNVKAQVSQTLNENCSTNNNSNQGGNMHNVIQLTDKVRKDSHNYRKRDKNSTRPQTHAFNDNSKTPMENTKFASIRNQLKLRDRFSNSDLDTPNMSKTEVINERTKEIPSDYVKRMLRQFEQKIENDNKPVKTKVQRHATKCRNNTTKSMYEYDSNVEVFESADNDNQETNSKNEKIERLRDNIVADISDSFQTGQSHKNEINNNYSEEEFDEIETTFHEMESTILEMQAAHRIQQEQQLTQDNSTTKSNSNRNTLEDDSSSSPRRMLQNNQNENDEKDRDSPIDDNMYYVIIDESCRDRDEEFGKSNFESLEDINFVEAYNRRGSELILTQVGQILRRSISQDRSSSTLNFSHKQFPEETWDKENENEKFHHTTSETGYLPSEVKVHSGTEFLNYFPGRNVINSKKSGSETTESEVSSNRSTLYSVSEYNDEDGHGGIDFGDVEVREKVVTFDQGIRRETYYNSQKNPIIEKICNLESCYMNHGGSHYDISSLGRDRKMSKEKRKIDYLAEELLSSEKKYISDLEKIITDYMSFLINEDTIPHHLIPKAYIVFGNIKKIYSRTTEFFNDLKSCEGIPELIADTFLKHEHLFQMYPIYYKNKPTADYYLTKEFRSDIIARQKHLGDRLGLASYLLTPVQRLGKYILLLEQIQKELTEEGTGTPSNKIQRAIEMVRKQMSRGNDFLAIDSIKGSPVNLAQQGSFIMREKFNIIKPRKFEAMLFLFEEIVVITTPDTRDPEKFIYRDSIRLDEMGIVTFENQPLVFHLKCFPSYNSATKEHVEFVIEAKRKKDKKVWTEQIEKRLWEQLFKCKEENSKIHGTYKKKPTKLSMPDLTEQENYTNSTSATLPDPKRSGKRSVFYYTLENARKTR